MGKAWGRIVADPRILGGKPVIKGTRISVSLILGLFAEGFTPKDIIREYPHLSQGDIRAAAKYASALLEKDRVALHHQLRGVLA